MNKILCRALLASCVAALLLSAYCTRVPQEPIDLEGLRSTGDDWTLFQDTLPDGGSIRLHQDKWLMYFLHWRPLTNEKEDISVEYARNLMLSFWGPEMPFTLTENAGEMQIAGHNAYFVEGTIYEGAVKTRFIVWNCPETKRQFIADCNINVRRGTPQALLDLQDRITSSVSCHGQVNVQRDTLLTKKFESEKFNLSFWIPENWRTSEFYDDEWFPQGLSDTNGTLWTLLTDSEKYAELRWKDEKKEISEALFRNYTEEIEKDSLVTKATLKLINFKVERIESRNGYFVGEGRFDYYLRAGGQELTKPFRFRAFLWKAYNKTYFLLASMVSLQEFWNMPVDLSPTDETFNRFVRDEVLANTRVFDKDYSDWKAHSE
jgi:hypothetical protein